MTLLADESVDGQIVYRLRADGVEVLYVAEMSPGLPDDEVLEAGRRAGAILITADKGFGELVFLQRRVSAGVVLLRLAGHPPEAKAEIVSRALHERSEEMAGAFSVVTPTAVRVHRVSP